MKIGAYVCWASDPHKNIYTVFHSWEEMIGYMRALYDRWVVQFLDSPLGVGKNVGRCDVYVELTVYDDYIE